MLEPAQQIRHALNTSNTVKVLEKAGKLGFVFCFFRFNTGESSCFDPRFVGPQKARLYDII